MAYTSSVYIERGYDTRYYGVEEDVIQEIHNFIKTENPHIQMVSRAEADNNILEIYNIIKNAEDKKFEMESWHCAYFEKGKNHCGTSHCLAGWAEFLFEENKYLEALSQCIKPISTGDIMTNYQNFGSDAEAAGQKYIWPIAHLFLCTGRGEQYVIDRIEEYLKRIGKI